MKKRRLLSNDAAWEEALNEYFESFIKLCFPWIHADVDWPRSYESLDTTNLREVLREAEIGSSFTDKLVKVWLVDILRVLFQQAITTVFLEEFEQLLDEFPIKKYRTGFVGTSPLNSTVADNAHKAVIDELKKDGWKEKDKLEAEDKRLFSFNSTLVHEEFNGKLTLNYCVENGLLIALSVKLDHSGGFDTIKKGFLRQTHNIEQEEMIQAAIKTVKFGMSLLLLEKSIF